MNKVFTPIGLIASLLLVVLLASCSKETILEEEEIITPEEEVVVAERTSTSTFVDAQSTVLQVFSSIVQESVRGSLPVSLSSSNCPDVDTYYHCGGNGTKLIIDYDNCEDSNGHTLDGKITITACVNNLLWTTKWKLGKIKLKDNIMIIDGYKFELKDANRLFFYCNIDDPNDPKFVFLAEPWAYFKITNIETHDVCSISPEIKGECDPFMEFRLNYSLEPDELLLNFQQLYNAEYLVKFNKNNCNEKWKVIVTPNGEDSEEFRTITGDDLLFSPSYGYPFDGNILCFYEWEPNFYALGEDWDFGSNANGCTSENPVRDSYAEICSAIMNPGDCEISTGCYVWDIAE